MKLFVRHASEIATNTGKRARHGREMSDLSIIRDGAVLIDDGMIIAVGPTSELDERPDIHDAEVLDATGHAMLPGFVDSHTHFIFGGYRADEFSWRLKGDDYLSIMERGGVINATVGPTRAASRKELFSLGWERLNRMLAYGVTTVEGKSGYGMDHDCEIKMLKVMRDLNETHPITLVSTFLGPHSVLPEYKGKERDFLHFMLQEVMPEVRRENLAVFADIFCEQGVFSVEDASYYLQEAARLGFRLKIHADEMASIGASEAGINAGAVSADHLLKIPDPAIEKMARSDTIAALLPLTAFCLKEPFAPGRKLIDRGCAVALATDLNPGSCFSCDIPLLIALSCIYMGLSIEEVITALTLNGAAALDMADRTGSIEVGKQADMLLLSFPSISYLPYHTGVNLVETVLKNGRVVIHPTAYR